MYRRTESGERIVWCLLESDAQKRAEVRIKRKLTEDELRTVQKGLEIGFRTWYEVMDLAINSVICPVLQRKKEKEMREGYEALRDISKSIAKAAKSLQKKVIPDY